MKLLPDPAKVWTLYTGFDHMQNVSNWSILYTQKNATKDITNKSHRWLSLIHTYSNDISNLTYFPTPKKKKKQLYPKKIKPIITEK